jgi:hypothetical protein
MDSSTFYMRTGREIAALIWLTKVYQNTAGWPIAAWSWQDWCAFWRGEKRHANLRRIAWHHAI